MPKKSSPSSEPYVVQYETKKSEFEYARFWDTRSYEDRAERILLRRLLKQYPAQSQWLTDVGGSFGRLLYTYSAHFTDVAIVDYATNEFHLSLKPAKEHKVSLKHIAANAYHLPFANSSQSAMVSVRVMHHLTEPEQFFKEIFRTLAPGGVAIVEAANKNSLKRFLKCLIKFDFSDWKSDWVDIGASGLQEDGSFHLIRNYHPAYLQRQMKEAGLIVRKKRTVSWFRRTFVTKLPRFLVDFLERIMQSVSSVFFYGPSSWYVLQKPGDYVRPEYDTVGASLIDPSTGKSMTPAQQKKKTKTNKKATYIDLRYPRPRR